MNKLELQIYDENDFELIIENYYDYENDFKKGYYILVENERKAIKVFAEEMDAAIYVCENFEGKEEDYNLVLNQKNNEEL